LTSLDKVGPDLGDLPLVCICVPTYNSAGTVRESLESILDQTYGNLVIHVSDNASTDDTLKVIESMADPRINIHRQEVNTGAEKNFTRCIQLATGKYAAIFHADDIYEPNMVTKQVEFLENSADVGAVFTEAIMIDEQGVPFGVTGSVPGRKRGVARIGFAELLRVMLLHHNFLVCPSVMVRTEIYKDEIKEWGSGLFRSASDVDTWLRLASRRLIAVLDERLMRYRFSTAQFSHKNRNRTERLDFFLVMDHYLARSDVRSFITRNDLRHYGWLERHERVARAMILFGLGRISESRDLLSGVLCWDAVLAAVSTRRGFVTLAGFALLRALIPFGASSSGIAIVKAAKKLSWR
jgi:glycosyltransferase involved in cell wall biosynthesis